MGPFDQKLLRILRQQNQSIKSNVCPIDMQGSVQLHSSHAHEASPEGTAFEVIIQIHIFQWWVCHYIAYFGENFSRGCRAQLTELYSDLWKEDTVLLVKVMLTVLGVEEGLDLRGLPKIYLLFISLLEASQATIQWGFALTSPESFHLTTPSSWSSLLPVSKRGERERESPPFLNCLRPEVSFHLFMFSLIKTQFSVPNLTSWRLGNTVFFYAQEKAMNWWISNLTLPQKLSVSMKIK